MNSPCQKSCFTWEIDGVCLPKYIVSGIVNITPDSFSDGGQFFEKEHALACMEKHVAEGAYILDIGAESTRPLSKPVSGEEERQRLDLVLDEALVLQKTKSIYISIDTYKASTAAHCLQKGIRIINDISGGSLDPAMHDIIAEYKPGYVLGHCPSPPKEMHKDPKYDNVVDTLLDFFSQQMDCLLQKGVSESSIVLDPCIGFAKTLEHNLEILRNLPKLLSLGRPLYLGISRKKFIGMLTGLEVDQRDQATQIYTALLLSQGAQIHRVHDVSGAVLAQKLALSLFPENHQELSPFSPQVRNQHYVS